MQKIFYYKLNIQNESEANGNMWPGSRICFKYNLKKFSWFRALKVKNKYSPFWKFWKEKKIDIIENGGWHFTYLMNYEKISNKIKSSEHSEFNKLDYTDLKNIKYRVENLIDPFDRNYKLNRINIDNTYPKYVLNNQEYYKDWILK